MRLHIRAEENKVFHTILRDVIRNVVKLRRNASVLDELDVASSFALLAREKDLTRPTLHKGFDHKIFGGRHITVEAGLMEQGKSFVGNNCFVGGNGERLWLITGWGFLVVPFSVTLVYWRVY
jgi:DNA mismatch repair ATPase MutS